MVSVTVSQRAWGLALTESNHPLTLYMALPQAPLQLRAKSRLRGAQIPPKSPKRHGKAGGRRDAFPPGRHRLPFGTRGSAAAVIIYQRCPAGRLKETRPEGTGIAGFLVLLPKPNKLCFLPSTAERHRDPARPEIATRLR